MAEGDDAVAVAQRLNDVDHDSAMTSLEGSVKDSLQCTKAHDIRASLGDAEDASVGFCVDLLNDLFAELRVQDDNDNAVRAAASFVWQQAMDGCLLAAAQRSETMDSADAEHSTRRQWTQFVRPRIQDDNTSIKVDQTMQPSRAGRSVVVFLGRLWSLFDTRVAFVETLLARYPTSVFRVSALPTPSHVGDWEIPVDDLGGFLRYCIRAAWLSVLSSMVDAVMQANALLLDKKRSARANLQLHHITLCVQSALLAAEEVEATPQGAGFPVLPTEIDRERSVAREEWLVHYLDDKADHAAPPIDRNATGSVVSKRELSSAIAKKQKLARSIVFSMLRQQRHGSNDSSKWGALRKQILVHQAQHVGIGVEATMAVKFAESPKSSSSPKKKTATASDTMTARLSPHKMSSDPDTAALSNIFSLGTPRQLSSDELAQRNDILSVLEREEALVSKRKLVAGMAAAAVAPSGDSMNGDPVLSETDKAFEEYIAANSSITVTNGSCHVPPSSHVQELSPTKQAKQRSTDPKRSSHGAGGGGSNAGRTKFDLALDPPCFDVVDGNSHARMAAEAAAAAALAATSRKSKNRGGALALVAPLRHAPSPPTSLSMRSPQPLAEPHPPHLRPLESASGQLPQLDTTRLAVGVKAVVRGVEKRGPRHDPSRNSRRRLHNYVSIADDEPDNAVSLLSPSKRSGASGGLDPESHLPPVSPVKASPHRKHVTFPLSPVAAPKPARDLSPQPPPLLESASPVAPNGSRRFPVKQPTFEKRTSPPRVRNRHFADSSNNPITSKRKYLGRHAWQDDDDTVSPDSLALRAPRRDLGSTRTNDD